MYLRYCNIPDRAIIRKSSVVTENNTERVSWETATKEVTKFIVFCMQSIFSRQNGISMPKGDRHGFSDGWVRTKWFQPKGRNAEVWLKSKQIQERNPRQPIVLWISLQREIRSWKHTSNDYTENFATVPPEGFVSKKGLVYVSCIESEPMTIDLIFFFFFFHFRELWFR